MKRPLIYAMAFAVTIFISACCSMNPQKCCQDDKQNQGEIEVDCGGPCDPCSTCIDGILNGEEIGVDCGGPDCPPTKMGKPCHCFNNQLDTSQGETSIDNGGPCGGGTTDPIATCEDGIQNGDEIGIDCGGAFCPDCAEPINLCTNGQLDSGEEEIDCGGDCPPCPNPVNLCTNGQLDVGESQIDCGGDCPPCPIRIPDIAKELMITDLNVIDSEEARTGVFSFGHLIRNMAPSSSADDTKALILSLLTSWESTQTVNGFAMAARPNVRTSIINSWKASDGQTGVSDAAWNMNLDNAPFRLMAIVNRVDLHKVNELNDNLLDRTGEGRFVYCAIDPVTNLPLQFTIIFEYHLPGNTPSDLIDWTKRWHNLGTFDSFNIDYVNALRAVTADFSTRGALPTGVNGNAIAQIRTNEVSLSFPWELREFVLNPATGLLQTTTAKQTPDISINNTQRLADFINANATAIDNNAHSVPETFNGPFLAGNVPTDPDNFQWIAPGINSSRMQAFSIETCNGCHGGSASTAPVNPLPQMTGPSFPAFTHIKPRFANTRTVLSNFLDGPGNNDLVKRREVMQQLMDELPPTADAASVLRFMKERGNRTH